jgi:glycyl-tRNA synthetase beta chain
MPDFLLEIGTEEIPARMIDAAAQELHRRVSDFLTAQRISPSGVVGDFSTPRRLTIVARGVPTSQADVEEQLTGPSLKVAYKDDKPTPAAEAFAKKAGVALDKLDRITTPKGEYIAARVTRKGRNTGDLIAEFLPKEIAGIYWPKNMYWRAGKPQRFVRPVRWIVALLDGEVVPLEFAGVRAGRESRGHRILSPGQIEIRSAKHYADALEHAFVMPSRAAREEHIRKELDAATRTIPGARWRENAELLATVVNLTEFPSVILGSFDREFLSLPEEVLVTVMRDHQKYFAVEDAQGKLAPHFLAVLNTDGSAAGVIRHGNERVMRARFNDARFFWQTDQKIPLRDRVQMLKSVTFQKDLGSYYDKAQRVAKLAADLAHQLAAADVIVDARAVRDAATQAKTDLTTELVKEFTELQGVVGGLYARAQGLGEKVADAIYDHYKPESMEDAAPKTLEGAVLSIADKADSIAGMFAIGLQPTGSKDPFALRRQANGMVKTIAEHGLSLRLSEIMNAAHQGYSDSEVAKRWNQWGTFDPSSRNAFFRERLEFYLRDVRSFAYDVVNAVLAAGADEVVDAVARAEAVSAIRSSADFESISISFKRMKNILRQAREAGKMPTGGGGGSGRMEPAEQELLDQSRATANLVRQLRAEKKYEQALQEISKLRGAIDKFFDDIMVMVDDESLRGMRLQLLERLVSEFTTIADFSEIVTEGSSKL